MAPELLINGDNGELEKIIVIFSTKKIKKKKIFEYVFLENYF